MLVMLLGSLYQVTWDNALYGIMRSWIFFIHTVYSWWNLSSSIKRKPLYSGHVFQPLLVPLCILTSKTFDLAKCAKVTEVAKS